MLYVISSHRTMSMSEYVEGLADDMMTSKSSMGTTVKLCYMVWFGCSWQRQEFSWWYWVWPFREHPVRKELRSRVQHHFLHRNGPQKVVECLLDAPFQDSMLEEVRVRALAGAVNSCLPENLKDLEALIPDSMALLCYVALKRLNSMRT